MSLFTKRQNESAVERAIGEMLEARNEDLRAVLERNQALLLTDKALVILNERYKTAKESGSVDNFRNMFVELYLQLNLELLFTAHTKGISTAWKEFESRGRFIHRASQWGMLNQLPH
jgi:hypothetical protein